MKNLCRFFAVLFILVLLLCSYGCASYTARTVTIQEVDKYTYKCNSAGAIIAVDPYYEESKQKEIFDTSHSSLISSGLMPVNFILSNKNSSSLMINKDDIVLVSPDGKTNKSLTVDEAYLKARKSTLGRTVLWGVLTGGIGAAIAGASSSGANDAIMTDLKNKEFQSQTVIPNTTISGFLYFSVPEDIKSLEGYKLTGLLKNGQGSSEFVIVLK